MFEGCLDETLGCLRSDAEPTEPSKVAGASGPGGFVAGGRGVGPIHAP